MGLDQDHATLAQPPTQRPQQPERILDAVQDPEAVDEIEALVELIKRERVHPAVLDARVQQTLDRADPLAALELDAPARGNPVTVLLVVDREHPPRAPTLGEECVEAVEGANIEHAHD